MRNFMRTLLFCIVLFCQAVLVRDSYVYAGLFRVESETLFSARNDDEQTLELPTYEFLSANYQSYTRDLDLSADLSVYGEPQNSRNDFRLHLLNLSYEAVPDVFRFNVGRNFDVQRSIRTTTIDTVGFDVFALEKRIQAGGFAGKEQRIEYKKWTPVATLSGAYLSFTTGGLTPFFSKLKYQHREYDREQNSHNASKEELVQISVDKAFSGAMSPQALLDCETNVGRRHLNRLESGFDLYPSYRTSLRIRALTYDLEPQDGIEQPIFSIFSEGRLYEASLQAERQLFAHLIGSVSVAYNNYLLQDPKRTDGIKVETDLHWSFYSFRFTNAFYALKSYGGEVYGGRVLGNQKLGDHTEFSEGVDLAIYNKVTGSKRPALNSNVFLHEALSNRLKLSVGGEMNSNNRLKFDVRAIAKLTYLLWTEI